MLKKILKKITALAIIFVIFGGLVSKLPSNNPSESNQNITVYSDIDSPDEKH